MRKVVLVLIIQFTVLSCSFPSYIFNNNAQTTGVDYTNGKWLLNQIDAPVDIKDKLTKLALDDFSERLKERVSYIPDTRGLLIPQKTAFNPNKSVLINLKKGTNYDYFINIKAAQTRNDFGALDITPHNFNNGGENTNEVTIEIYDLNNLQIIYSQKVTATVGRPKDNQDVHLSKTSNSLIVSAYKKLIKDIDKRSIH